MSGPEARAPLVVEPVELAALVGELAGALVVARPLALDGERDGIEREAAGDPEHDRDGEHLIDRRVDLAREATRGRQRGKEAHSQQRQRKRRRAAGQEQQEEIPNRHRRRQNAGGGRHGQEPAAVRAAIYTRSTPGERAPCRWGAARWSSCRWVRSCWPA